MSWRAVVLLWVLSACGRIGFAAAGDGPGGADCSQAAEQCNGVDDNCDGAIDEGCACEPFDVTVPSSTYGAGLAWLGDGYAVLTLANQANLRVLDQAGSVRGASPLPPMNPPPVRPTGILAWTGSELAAVWASGSQIELGRFAPDASPLGTPIIVSTTGASAGTPQLAWAGDRHVVMWLDAQQLEIREVTADGAPIRQLHIPGLSRTEGFGSFAVTPDHYAVVLSDSDLVGTSNPDELVLIDRAAWTASPQQSLTVGSQFGFPPEIFAGPDGQLAVLEPRATSINFQVRGRDGAPLAAPTLIPAYASDTLRYASVAPADDGYRVTATSNSHAWDETFDPITQSWSPAVLRATFTSDSVSPLSVAEASGRRGLALTYGTTGTPSTARLLQSCP